MFPLIAALILIAARLPAQQPEHYAIEQLAEGYIDWTQHGLFAYGDGRAPAAVTDPVQQRLYGLRNARDAAFGNIGALIGQVRLNADTQLQDADFERDFQELAYAAIGSQSEDQGHYRIAVRLPLLGDFAAAVLPQVEPIDPKLYDLSRFDFPPATPASDDSLETLAAVDSLEIPVVADSLAALAPADSLTTPVVADSLALPTSADSLATIVADSLAALASADSLATPVDVDSLALPASADSLATVATDSLALPASADSLATVATDSLATPSSADSLAADNLVFFVPEAPYTGLLIDVRGLGLQPSIAPRVLSAAGHVIHGVATVDRSLATDYGVTGYDDDIDRAYASERLGGKDANPFVVKATGTAGRYSGDVILDNFDAAQVLQADQAGDFLRQGRVTFLLGPAPAPFDSTYSERVKHEFELYGEMEPSDSAQ